MKEAIRNQLNDIQNLVRQLTDDEYTTKQEILSGSSIGQHIRHILEFNICLFRSFDSGVVCYDQRERDTRIETDRLFAAHHIASILHQLNHISQNRVLRMQANFTCNTGLTDEFETSVYRELAYNLEHGVHHQALIKIAVRQIGRGELLNENFGVASSTIRFQNKLVTHMANHGA